MSELAKYQTVYVVKIRQTGASHGADAFKTKLAPALHTTDGFKTEAGLLSHSISSFKSTGQNRFHTADSLKTASLSSFVAGHGGIVLAESDNVAPGTTALETPELSKNANNFISIGSGLSAMIGLPRIATWNTAGRPKRPKTGTIGFNTQTRNLEFWNGKYWFFAPMNGTTT